MSARATSHRRSGGKECAPSSGSLHHHLALPLSKGIRELCLVMLGNEVIEVRLTTELVYPLCNLVARSVSQTREEREKLGSQRCTGRVAENDRRERPERNLRNEIV